MGMTLKELLTKGEGTLTAGEAKTLASQCRMDVETLYTLLEERGIKILDDEADGDTSLDVEGIMAEVESAEANSDELGLGVDEEEEAEETPVGRLGSADEVAQLLVFLAGESAGYITGQVFGVNGGLVI